MNGVDKVMSSGKKGWEIYLCGPLNMVARKEVMLEKMDYCRSGDGPWIFHLEEKSRGRDYNLQLTACFPGLLGGCLLRGWLLALQAEILES